MEFLRKMTSKRVLKNIAAALLLLTVISFTGFGILQVSAATDSAETTSFANMTSAAATYLSSAISPDGSGATLMPTDSLLWTNAGGLVGYADTKDGLSAAADWLMSAVSRASQEADYKAYKKILVNATTTSNDAYYYLMYGKLLNQMGLDGAGGQGIHPIRVMAGLVLLICYALAGIVPAVFNTVIVVLKTLNPFQLFSITGYTKIISGVAGADAGALSTAAAFLQPIMDTVADLGLTLFLPLYLVGLLTEIYLFKKTKTSSAVKKFTLRLCAIVLGLPLLGATYTDILNYMGENTDVSTCAATETIYSILVDFESWAENGRLSFPNGYSVGWADADNTQLTNSTIFNERNICYKINATYSNGELTNRTRVLGSDIDEALNYNVDLYTGARIPTENSYIRTIDLIRSYMNSDTYSSASFESTVKSGISSGSSSSGPAGITTIGKIMNATNEYDDWVSLENSTADAKISDTGILNHEILTTDEGNDGDDALSYNPWGNGSHLIEVHDGDITPGIVYQSSAAFNSGTSLRRGGLSTMSMYNYLNTSFANSKVKFYTSDASSMFVRESHYSVNLIGSGFRPFAYWINGVSLMLCFVVIGLWYCVSMIGTIISRSIRLIMTVPAMLVGSVKAFARVIVYTIIMITQVIGTMLLYEVMTKLIMAANGIITIPIADKITLTSTVLPDGVLAAINSGGLYPILLILGSLFQFVFIFIAIKERKKFLKGIEEAAEQVIDRLMDTKSSPDNGASFAENLAKGGAMAAGMAAAAKVASSDGKKADTKDKLANTKDAVSDENADKESPDATGGGGVSDGNNGIEGEPHGALEEKKPVISGEDRKEIEGEDYKRLEMKPDGESEDDGSGKNPDNPDSDGPNEEAEDDGNTSPPDGPVDGSDGSDANEPMSDEDIAEKSLESGSLAAAAADMDNEPAEEEQKEASADANAAADNAEEASLEMKTAAESLQKQSNDKNAENTKNPVSDSEQKKIGSSKQTGAETGKQLKNVPAAPAKQNDQSQSGQNNAPAVGSDKSDAQSRLAAAEAEHSKAVADNNAAKQKSQNQQKKSSKPKHNDTQMQRSIKAAAVGMTVTAAFGGDMQSAMTVGSFGYTMGMNAQNGTPAPAEGAGETTGVETQAQTQTQTQTQGQNRQPVRNNVPTGTPDTGAVNTRINDATESMKNTVAGLNKSLYENNVPRQSVPQTPKPAPGMNVPGSLPDAPLEGKSVLTKTNAPMSDRSVGEAPARQNPVHQKTLSKGNSDEKAIEEKIAKLEKETEKLNKQTKRMNFKAASKEERSEIRENETLNRLSGHIGKHIKE